MYRTRGIYVSLYPAVTAPLRMNGRVKTEKQAIKQASGQKAALN